MFRFWGIALLMMRPWAYLGVLGLGLLAVPLWAAPPALRCVNLGTSSSPDWRFETVGGNCPVRLVGADCDGLEWSGSGSIANGVTVLNEVQEAVQYWHANCVRIPLDQDWWDGNAQTTVPAGQTTARGAVSQSSYQGLVQAIVSYCQSAGVYCDLDLQWSGSGTAGSAVNQYPMPDSNAATFWTSVATMFANNTSVIFDTFNEPFPGPNSNNAADWSLWQGGGTIAACGGCQQPFTTGYTTPGIQSLINTIRATGALNVCIAGGIEYANTFSGGPALTDPGYNGTPGNGVAYSIHIYNNNSNDNPTGWNANVDPALANGPVLIEEFGNSANTTDNGAFVQSVLGWMDGGNDKGYVYGGMAWDMNLYATPVLISAWSTTLGAPGTNGWVATPYEGTTVYAWLTSTAQPVCSTPTDTPGSSPSATATATATHSPTLSPSATSTATATVTATRSLTLSPSATSTMTPTRSATASPKATPTATPSSTATPTTLSTATPTWSATSTGTASPATTPAATFTAVPSASATATSGFGASATASPSASATASPSATATTSPSATATTSPSATATTSPSATATTSPSATATTSPSASATASPSATATTSPSATATASPSATATTSPSASATISPSASATASPSATTTASPTVTATASATATASLAAPVLNPPSQSATVGQPLGLTLTGANFAVGDTLVLAGSAGPPLQVLGPTQVFVVLPASDFTQTGSLGLAVQAPSGLTSGTQALTVKEPSSPTPAGGPLVVSALFPVPNPNPDQLAVHLEGPSDAMEVSVYTKALVLALRFETPGLSAGWQSLNLPAAFGHLPNGIYYLILRAHRGAAWSQPAMTKAMVLR